MNHKLTIVTSAIIALLISLPADAAKRKKGNKNVRITEKVKYYGISGRTAADFAASMSKNGPYSRQHRRRAWATAARDVTYQVDHKRTSRGCGVKRASVKMTITYTLPKLRTRARVSRRERSKWKKMYRLLNKHERVHGRYYRDFAYQVQNALRKLGPSRTCWQLDRKAAAVVEKLNVRDRNRNNRFDARDGRNYSRMVKIYSGS